MLITNDMLSINYETADEIRSRSGECGLPPECVMINHQPHAFRPHCPQRVSAVGHKPDDFYMESTRKLAAVMLAGRSAAARLGYARTPVQSASTAGSEPRMAAPGSDAADLPVAPYDVYRIDRSALPGRPVHSCLPPGHACSRQSFISADYLAGRAVVETVFPARRLPRPGCG